MRMVFGLVLMLGLGLAGFAVYMAKDYVGAYEKALKAERAVTAQMVPTVQVFTMKRPIKYGEKVKIDDVQVIRWPENAIPEGAFLKEEDLFPDGENKLRTVVRAMEKDEALLAIKLTSPGEDAGITSRLTKGMRAFAIRVDVSTGVSGFLRPGDRVDVYWSGRSQDKEVTKLIEAGVQLIAVDQESNEDRKETKIAQTVTVEITPQQVASLAQAQTTGRLSLSLVGAEDDTIAEAIEVDQMRLLGIQEAQEEVIVEQQVEKVCTIKTRRGAEVLQIPIPCTN
ncbi:MAG: Flp pilus assembly protein CpaB [Pseudoruegeria sp.]